MRSTKRQAGTLAIIAAVLGIAVLGRAAHAQTPGSVLVIGTAGDHERGVVEAAISNRVRDATWSVVARPFSRAEVESIVGCLPDDRPWPCIEPTARSKGISQLLIAQVDRTSTKTSLAIKAQLLVAGNGVPAIGEAYCDACSDSQLRETAVQITEQLLKDTALRTQTRETVLEIRTVPAGAAVTVDGKQVGVSDLRHRASPGPHTVLVERTGYVPETRSVTLVEGETSKLALELRPTSTGRNPRIVPGIVIGAGLAAVIGGSIVSFTAEDSPEGQKHKYVYSAPGIGVAMGGAIVAGAGVYLWVRASRRPNKRAVPAVSTVPGGAVAGWATTF
jgi:hypothetical protein